MNFLYFMIFSTIEGFAVYAYMLYLFRFKLKDYFFQALIFILLLNLQSFYLREDTSLFYVVPIINLVFLVLFMKCVARMSLVGSLVSAATGYACFIILQLLIVYFSNGYLSVEEVKENPFKGYILQFLTGSIGIVIPHSLYTFGLGISTEFDKFKFKWEDKAVLFSIIVFGIIMGIVLYIGNLHLLLLFFIISMIGMIYYAIRKEKDDIDN